MKGDQNYFAGTVKEDHEHPLRPDVLGLEDGKEFSQKNSSARWASAISRKELEVRKERLETCVNELERNWDKESDEFVDDDEHEKDNRMKQHQRETADLKNRFILI